MLMDSPSSHLFVKGAGDVFYRLSNADGKEWLLPARNMRVALNLYQPSGRNGKLLKKLFPMLHRIPFVQKTIGAQTECYRLNDELSELLESLFNEREIEFAVFFGTPCIHQKITIQISRKRHILGYLKISDSTEVGMLFQHESRILKKLHHSGVTAIPQCLYCGTLSDKSNVFVQSTVKSQWSKVVHQWTPKHDEFIQRLYQNTHQMVLFEKSDYYHTLTNLREHINWLPQYMDSLVVVATIDEIMSKWKGKEVDFSAYHGDFTPWNMFVENHSLFVFDWEYARLSYPPMLDRYHFFTQTLIFERRWGTPEIISFMQTDDCKWISVECYKLYLIDAISRFTIREKGNTEAITPSMKVWGGILSYLCK